MLAGAIPMDEGRGGAARRATLTATYVLLAAVAMLFAAFTSAMVVRRGLSDDWVRLALPPILWWNTAALLASSVALETARRALNRGHRDVFNRYWTAAALLGMLFLAGQFLAWRQLNARGIYLATNPSSSFFFVLTAAHALHLAGGICALVYIDAQALRFRLGPAKRSGIEFTRLYWHFLGGLWVYVLLLFQFWG